MKLFNLKKQKNSNLNDVAASYQNAIIEVLTIKLLWAMDKTNCDQCVIAGGVAANKSLRKSIKTNLYSKKVIFPDMAHCTDNAAMIAFLGELYLSKKNTSPIDFPILPNLKLT